MCERKVGQFNSRGLLKRDVSSQLSGSCQKEKFVPAATTFHHRCFRGVIHGLTFVTEWNGSCTEKKHSSKQKEYFFMCCFIA